MHINPLHTRQESTEDGIITQTQWGYCKQQNAVRIGYCVNFLAALMGLVLIIMGHKAGLVMDVLVGMSFGAAYFAEHLPYGFKRGLLTGASIACVVCAYITAIALAMGG